MNMPGEGRLTYEQLPEIKVYTRITPQTQSHALLIDGETRSKVLMKAQCGTVA